MNECLKEESPDRLQPSQDSSGKVLSFPGHVSETTSLVLPLFLARVAQDPDHLALVGDETLTYLQLHERSNQLAHYLRSLGAGPETLIGICMGRSVRQVISALGVLKAGSAYLPLDPATPPDRLAFMLTDARVATVLAQPGVASSLSCGHRNVIDVNDPQISNYATHAVEGTASASDLAYVIYTSGSTGWPKGVEITHGSLRNLVQWHQQAFAIDSTDRATLLASPGFDAAVWELWPYLTVGASLFLPQGPIQSDPESLRDWMVAQGITISFVATPLAERMLTLCWPADTMLRIMLTGADTLHRYPAPELPFALVNNYGPTECTVVASSGVVHWDEGEPALPSIGRPIANTHIYLLDEHMEEVPFGEMGEICIGGDGLARGYRNHPELTTERFVPNPFSNDHGSRLYKTGDLARYLPDGRLAFVGRIDQQIKIRGFRVEPDEIVAALNRHPLIQQSQVVARVNANGEKQLVAYVVPKPGSKLRARDPQDSLASELPQYMVPAIFVALEGFPLSANGKIDLAKLPIPDAANVLRDEVVALPRTPVEDKVSAIVASLLMLASVNVHDNFFMLGGHSLLGTQVIGKVRDTFAVDLPLHRLFESPTISDLSTEIDRLLVAKAESEGRAREQRTR